MQSSAKIFLSVFLLTSAFISAYHNNAKLRRDGVLNLYPFPRVGRASQRTWQVPINDFYLEDYEPVDKRQLYAFPRVGRGETALLRDPPELQAVPIRRTDSPGMWFGPRLGRSVNSHEDHISLQNENNERSEPEQLELENLERKKRGASMMRDAKHL